MVVVPEDCLRAFVQETDFELNELIGSVFGLVRLEGKLERVVRRGDCAETTPFIHDEPFEIVIRHRLVQVNRHLAAVDHRVASGR